MPGKQIQQTGEIAAMLVVHTQFAGELIEAEAAAVREVHPEPVERLGHAMHSQSISAAVTV